MSEGDNFHPFPLLTLEIRLLIWSFTLLPRIISLEPECYGKGEDASAMPHWKILGRRQPDPDYEQTVTRRTWSARFIPSVIPPQSIFQVSHESRNHAFFLGYLTWKMQRRGGRVRNILWDPATDIILLPRDPMSDSEGPKIDPHLWLRMFRAQYPKETGIAQNLALHTSIWKGRTLENIWVSGQLFKFKLMKSLTLVIDEMYERSRVATLVERNEEAEAGGPWKLPDKAVEALERNKNKEEELRSRKIPEVRIVEDVSSVLTSQNLQLSLRCNPCDYLDNILLSN